MDSKIVRTGGQVPVREQAGGPGPTAAPAQTEPTESRGTTEPTLGELTHHGTLKHMARTGLLAAAQSKAFQPANAPSPAEGASSREAFVHSLKHTGGRVGLEAAKVGMHVASLYFLAFTGPEAAEAATVKEAHHVAAKEVGETSVKELADPVDKAGLMASVRQTVGLGLRALADSSMFASDEWRVNS